jgi:hypothetical protein
MLNLLLAGVRFGQEKIRVPSKKEPGNERLARLVARLVTV